MNKDIKEKWFHYVSNEIYGISVEEIYKLLNPIDNKEFFVTVNSIIDGNRLKGKGNGKCIGEECEYDYISDFKITSVIYLIEFEKDQSSNSQIYIPTTSPIVYPSYPTNVPGITTPVDPYPYKLPVVWCGNAHSTNQYFYTTTTSVK